MEEKNKKEEFKKTQTTSSPGSLGEDANRNDRKPSEPINENEQKTSQEEGYNEVRSEGDSGAFEGLEDTGK